MKSKHILSKVFQRLVVLWTLSIDFGHLLSYLIVEMYSVVHLNKITVL